MNAMPRAQDEGFNVELTCIYYSKLKEYNYVLHYGILAHLSIMPCMQGLKVRAGEHAHSYMPHYTSSNFLMIPHVHKIHLQKWKQVRVWNKRI